MTPSDRAALAVALQDATPETLRRLGEERAAIADWMKRSWRDRHARIPPDITAQVQDHRIMAALALAVAAMQERGDARVEQALTGGDFLCTDTPIHGMPYGGCDLMSALAALLKGDQ